MEVSPPLLVVSPFLSLPTEAKEMKKKKVDAAGLKMASLIPTHTTRQGRVETMKETDVCFNNNSKKEAEEEAPHLWYEQQREEASHQGRVVETCVDEQKENKKTLIFISQIVKNRKKKR